MAGGGDQSGADPADGVGGDVQVRLWVFIMGGSGVWLLGFAVVGVCQCGSEVLWLVG